MSITPTDLPSRLRQVRENFDRQLADVLQKRTDLSQPNRKAILCQRRSYPEGCQTVQHKPREEKHQNPSSMWTHDVIATISRSTSSAG